MKIKVNLGSFQHVDLLLPPSRKHPMMTLCPKVRVSSCRPSLLPSSFPTSLHLYIPPSLSPSLPLSLHPCTQGAAEGGGLRTIAPWGSWKRGAEQPRGVCRARQRGREGEEQDRGLEAAPRRPAAGGTQDTLI